MYNRNVQLNLESKVHSLQSIQLHYKLKTQKFAVICKFTVILLC